MEPHSVSTREEEPGNVAPHGFSMPFASPAPGWAASKHGQREEVQGHWSSKQPRQGTRRPPTVGLGAGGGREATTLAEAASSRRKRGG